MLLLVMMSGMLWAQIPTGYYNSAEGKTGTALKSALHDIIKGHTNIGYNGLEAAFAVIDKWSGGEGLWDIYSNYHYTSGIGSSFDKEGDGWNREHLWPQSWFNEQAMPRADLFHVYPTDGFVNNKRSSYPFGRVGTATYTSGNGSKLGNCVSEGYSGTVFEPVDEYKGDIARSLLYMSVRYMGEDDSWDAETDMTLKSEIKPWALKVLLAWNNADPVSQKEINRNNAIYNDYQHNRNPFIDHPEYAEAIWGDGSSTTPSGVYYAKVTQAPEDWSGEYLIVCEESSVAFNGALTTLDAVNNNIGVSYSAGIIESNETVDAATFTIEPSGNGYAIKSNSGFYIGNGSNSNGLTAGNDALVNTLSMDGNDVNIVGSGGAYLRYNPTSGQARFRYFKSSTYASQKAIQLYKKTEAAVQITHTITFHNGTETTTQTVNDNESTKLNANTFVKSGYDFSGWNTEANGSGDSYADEATVTLTTDLDLYAQWTKQAAVDGAYVLVTSASQLAAGKTVLIVNVANSKALGTTQNTNNRSAADVTISNGNAIESIGDDVCQLTLGGSTGAWTFYDDTNGGYLYAASSSSNQLKTQSTLNDNGKWNIEIGNNGTATLTAQGSNSRNVMQYNANNGSPIFSCYGSASQLDVCLFIAQESAVESLILADDDSTKPTGSKNSDLISQYDSMTVDVTLQGRTLIKDGKWNTLCLPFSTAKPEGATLKQLSGASISGSTLTLNFDEASSIVAGQPYLISWANGDNIDNPVFTGVLIDAQAPSAIGFTDQSGSFVGSYTHQTFTDVDRTILFVGENNNVYYPVAGATIGAFRAFFQLDGFTAGDVQAPTRFVLNFDGETQGIVEKSLSTASTRSYYNLGGQRLAKPMRGISIIDGRKVVRR